MASCINIGNEKFKEFQREFDVDDVSLETAIMGWQEKVGRDWGEEDDEELGSYLKGYFMEGVEVEVSSGMIGMMERVYREVNGKEYGDREEMGSEVRLLKEMFGDGGVRVVRGVDGVERVLLAKPVVGDDEGRVGEEAGGVVVDFMEKMGMEVERISEGEGEQEMVRGFGKERPYKNREKASKKDIEAIQGEISGKRYNKSGSDVVRVGRKIYLIDHSSHEEYEENVKDGDGFGIRNVYKIGDIDERDIREIVRNIAADYGYAEERVREVLQAVGIRPENLSGINIDAELKRSIDNNAVGDAGGRGSRSEVGAGRGSESGGEDIGEGEPIRSADGRKVLGYVKDGKIYLQEGVIDANTPIHEYTHLWDEAVAHANPALWKRGVELMKQTTLWGEVERSKDYGKKWAGLPEERREFLIASEVHARIVGDEGEAVLSRLEKRRGAEGIIGKLREWLSDFYKFLAKTFSKWSERELNSLTLDEFSALTLRDFTEGFNPTKVYKSEGGEVQERRREIRRDLQRFPSKLQRAIIDVERMMERNAEDITRKPDFAESHIYGIATDKMEPGGWYDRGRWWRPADTSVTQSKTALSHGRVQPFGEKKTNPYYVPAVKIGNILDAFCRDFFLLEQETMKALDDATGSRDVEKVNEILDKSGKVGFMTKNMTPENRMDLVDSLFRIIGAFNDAYGMNNWKVFTNEFPMAVRYNENGESKTMVGTLDMLLAYYDTKTKSVKYRVVDFKTFRTDPYETQDSEKLLGYGVQTSAYKSMLETSDPGIFIDEEGESRITGTNLLAFDIYVPAFEDEEMGKYPLDFNASDYDRVDDIVHNYEEAEDGTLLYKGEPIMLKLNWRPFDRQAGPVDYGTVEPHWWQEGYTSSFTSQEIMLADYREMFTREYSQPRIDQMLNEVRHNDLGMTQTECSFVGNNIVALASSWIDNIRKNSTYRNNVLAGTTGEANLRHFMEVHGETAEEDLAHLSREEFLDLIDINNVFRFVKEMYFNSENTKDGDKKKLKFIYSHFDAFLEYGSAKLIELENRQLRVAKPKNVRQEGEEERAMMNDIVAREEQEREYWTVGQRQLSARETLSKQIRRLFGRIVDPMQQGRYGYEMPVYVEASKAVDKCLGWLRGCYTIEAMERELKRHARNNMWVYEILEAIKEEPIRSEFFQNFRKDSLTYTVVEATWNKRMKCYEFRTHIINEKGSVTTALEEAREMLRSGGSRLVMKRDGLMVTSDDRPLYDKEAVAEASSKAKDIAKRWVNRDKAMPDNERETFIKVLSEEMSELYYDIGLGMLNPDVVESYLADRFDGEETRKEREGFMSDVVKVLNVMRDNPTNLLSETNQRSETGYPAYNDILKRYAGYMEAQVESSAYDNGKTYYTFATPSYAMRLFDELGNHENFMSEDEYQKYMEENFGQFKWFKDNGQWRNKWLRDLNGEDKLENRKNLLYKVQLSFNGVEYTKLSELGYALSLLTEFEYWDNESHTSGEKQKYAWYRMPIFSNKPSSEFVRGKRYDLEECRSLIPSELVSTMLQEMNRIKDVFNKACAIGSLPTKNMDLSAKDKEKFKEELERYKNGELTEKDYLRIVNESKDANGASLKFLSFLNNNPEITAYIVAYLNGQDFDSISFNEAVTRNITEFMDRKCEEEFEYWKKIGLFDTHTQFDAKKKKDVEVYDWLDKLFHKDELEKRSREQLEEKMKKRISEFVWNDFFASVNIIQLTVTDMAFYKNAEDFQKRYAQLHSPAMRLNETATFEDSTGKHRFSDGIERSMKLKDFVIPAEKTREAVEKAFDYLIDKAKREMKDGIDREAVITHYEHLKKTVVPMFDKNNVADAQGYCCPTSYRKRAAMQGQWDMNGKQEQAYQRIISGDFNVSDLEFLCQPLKGFVYGQMDKMNYAPNASDDGAAVFPRRKVPVQQKNSEYMLFLADAILRGVNESESNNGIRFGNELIAMFDFMEGTAYDGRAIYRDGHIWLNNNMVEDGVKVKGDDGFEYVVDDKGFHRVGKKKANVAKDGFVISKGTYNGNGIDTIQFESAVKSGLSGEVDINSVDGTSRSYAELMEILSEAAYADESHLYDAYGDKYDTEFVDEVRYSEYGIQQPVPDHFQDHEQQMGSQMRILSVTDLSNEAMFGIPMFGNSISGRALQNEYQELIAQNIMEDYNQLVHDLGLESKDKIHRNLVISELLKESIRRDSKYNIDLTYSVSLNKDGDFNIPLTDPTQAQKIEALLNSIIKSRINKQQVTGGPVVQTSSYGLTDNLQIEYQEDGITPKCFHCMIPIPSEDLADILEKRDEDGNRTGEFYTLEEALKLHLISAKDKAWLEKAVGYRIPTEDKYSMVPIKMVGFTPRAAGEVVMMPYDITLLSGSDFDIDKLYIMVPSMLPNEDYNPSKATEEDYKESVGEEEKYRGGKDFASRFHFSKNLTTREGRDNKILMMQYSVLTNVDTVEKLFNPGNFENLRDVAEEIMECKGGSMDSGRNICFASTQVYFHQQNMTGGALIGVFANNNTSHGFISMYPTTMRMTSKAFEVNGVRDVPFIFKIEENGKEITVGPDNNNTIDRLRAFDKSLISKNIASYLAASVDTAKDPVLRFMNINTTTVDAAMVLIRLGFSPQTVGYLMSQPIIEEVTEIYERRSNTGHYVDIQDVISDVYEAHFKKKWRQEKANLSRHLNDAFCFKTEVLKQNIRAANGLGEIDGETKRELDENLLMLFSGLKELGTDLGDLTFATKFNSVTNAPGPRVSDNIAMYNRVERLYNPNNEGETRFVTHDDEGYEVRITDASPILKAFYDTTINVGESTHSISELLFGSFFVQYSPEFQRILDYFTRHGIRLTNDEIDEMSKDFMLYCVTGVKGWLKGEKVKDRHKALSDLFEKMPKTLMSMKRKKKYRDNPLLQALMVNRKNRRMPISVIETVSSQFGREGESLISNAWADMMAGTTEERDFAERLFIYAVSRGGFGYLPRNFAHLAPPELRQQILDGRYLEALRSPTDLLQGFTERDGDNFIRQYILNHSYNEKFIEEFDHVPTADETDAMVVAVTSKDGKMSKQLMVLIPDTRISKDAKVIYTKAQELGSRFNLKEYDRMTAAADMVSLIDESERDKLNRYKRRGDKEAFGEPSKVEYDLTDELGEYGQEVRKEADNNPNKTCK